jgi:hypothetical protein
MRRLEGKLPTDVEMDDANEQEITNCEQKSAYIWKPDEILLEMDYLSKYYPGKKWTSGKGGDDDMIYKGMEGFTFYEISSTDVSTQYRWMMDTGIWDRLQVEKRARRIRLRRERGKKNQKKQGQWKKPDGVSSLERGLVTVFILCGSLVLLGLSCFVLECRHLIWKGMEWNYVQVEK